MTDSIGPGTDLEQSKKIETILGEITVTGVTLECTFALMDKIEELKLAAPPVLMDRTFIELNADSGEEAQKFMAQNYAERAAAIMRWVFSSRDLAPIALAHCTDIDDGKVGKLTLRDTLLVGVTVIECMGIESTVETVVAFFHRLGGLMDKLDLELKQLGGKGQAATASPATTTGASASSTPSPPNTSGAA